MKLMTAIMLLIALFFFSLPAGCMRNDQDQIEKIILNESYIDEEGIEIKSAGSYPIPLEGSEGLLVLTIYNDSDRRVNAAEPITLSFYDENEILVATGSTDNAGTAEKFRMIIPFPGKGTLVCDKPSGVIRLAMAHASANSPVKLDNGAIIPVLSTETGTAEYKLDLDENRLVQFSGKTAFIDEEECNFTIYLDETPILSDVAIETAKWSSRQLYLEKGSYTVIFQGIKSDEIFQCQASFDETLHPVFTGGNGHTQYMDGSNEKVIGFLSEQDQWLKVDREGPFQVNITSDGLKTYSDAQTFFTLEVYNGDGSMVYNNAGDTSVEQFNLPASESGYYFRLALTNSTNGVVKVSLEDL